jgi:hypothetical protein
MQDNTTVYIIAAVVILHFLIGAGIVIYKVMKGDKKMDN